MDSADDGTGTRFALWPDSRALPPGQKQTIQIGGTYAVVVSVSDLRNDRSCEGDC